MKFQHFFFPIFLANLEKSIIRPLEKILSTPMATSSGTEGGKTAILKKCCYAIKCKVHYLFAHFCHAVSVLDAI